MEGGTTGETRYFCSVRIVFCLETPRMRSLRSTWSRRWVVAVLVTSLLPLVAGPLGDGVSEEGEAHALWLRAQVDGAVPDGAEAAFDAALKDAQATAGSSLEAFTAAFAESYRQQATSVSLGTLFALPSWNGATLYRALHQRAQQLGTHAAVPPRLTGPATASTPTVRLLALPAAIATGARLEASWGSVRGPRVGRLPGSLIHLFCAVQPLGP